MKIKHIVEQAGKFRSRASEEAVMDKNTLMDMKDQTVPDWEMLDHRILTAKYFAKNHRQAVEFVDFINRVSEYLDHFAEVTQDVAEVTVKTTTSDTNSLTILDFALAKAIDEYAQKNNIQQERIQGNFDESIIQKITELDIRSSKSYTQVDDYRMYPVYVTKQKFKNKFFIASAVHPRTHKEIAKANGKNPQQAIENLHAEIDKMFASKPVVDGNAVIDFNVDFANKILSFPGQEFYAKIIEGPKLVIAGKEMLEYPEIMKDEGFKKSAIRTQQSQEGSTKLPAIAYTAKQIAGKGVKANARYLIGPESKDKDGNKVFDLIYDSDVYDKGHLVRLNKPGLTIGTKRD